MALFSAMALSAWLPKFYVDTFRFCSHTALMTATFILPAGLLRPLGGHFSGSLGPRGVTYGVHHDDDNADCTVSPQSFARNVGIRQPYVRARLCDGHRKSFRLHKYIPDYFPNDVVPLAELLACWAL
jgi:hypothetical protein